MTAMGGRIYLEPNGFGGSRFVVALPPREGRRPNRPDSVADGLSPVRPGGSMVPLEMSEVPSALD